MKHRRIILSEPKNTKYMLSASSIPDTNLLYIYKSDILDTDIYKSDILYTEFTKAVFIADLFVE